MNININDKITIKLFLGLALTADLKNDLSKSHRWKEAQIVRSATHIELEETLCEGKKYIGLYCNAEKTLSELNELKTEISVKIREYCPEFIVEKGRFQIFPQVFVG